MGRNTRRMIERLEPFAESLRGAAGAPLAKAGDDRKDSKRKDVSAPARRRATKPRAK